MHFAKGNAARRGLEPVRAAATDKTRNRHEKTRKVEKPGNLPAFFAPRFYSRTSSTIGITRAVPAWYSAKIG